MFYKEGSHMKSIQSEVRDAFNWTSLSFNMMQLHKICQNFVLNTKYVYYFYRRLFWLEYTPIMIIDISFE